jgi:regulator of protease activity HflC (stomatin/prohibitin superfamily)
VVCGITQSSRAAVVSLVSVLLFIAIASPAAAQSEEGSFGALVFWFTTMVVVLVLIFAIQQAAVVIQPWEIGLKIVMGKYGGKLMPGLAFVPPFITKVIHMDLRERVVNMDKQEVIFRDKTRGIIDLVLYYKVVDPEMAAFQVENFKRATNLLAQTSFRRAVSELTFDELVDNQELICNELRTRMLEETDPWGVKVHRFDLGEMREN